MNFSNRQSPTDELQIISLFETAIPSVGTTSRLKIDLVVFPGVERYFLKTFVINERFGRKHEFSNSPVATGELQIIPLLEAAPAFSGEIFPADFINMP
ncbi:MAG: hypothetical protein LBU79_09680, partial [Planctomycetota bacterium]|nr:hypothetical protein [Planctomycetota bacterium]